MKNREIEENEEIEKIKKGNTNKLLIIFFLILFILLFSVVIVLNQINIRLEKQLEELEALTVKTEQDIDDIKNDVNSKIENAIENLIENELENTVDSNKEDNVDEDNLDSKLKSKFTNFTYRKDDGASAGFFMKNGVLYSGEESVEDTHSKVQGIIGNVKYVIPINKQIGKTLILTKEGFVYVNVKDESGLYGAKFERYIEKVVNFEEVIQLEDENKLYLVTKDAKIYDVETGLEFSN